MTGMSENAFINVKNRSVTITADVVIPARGASGVVLAQGGRFGGWSLYLKGGRPTYTYNFLGLQRTTVTAAQPVPAGKATVKMEFAYAGGGVGQGGLVTLSINGKKAGQGRVERTQPGIFSVDDAADVGMDEGTPVIEDYQPRDSKFTGTIKKVVVEVGAMGAGDKAAAKKASGEAARKLEEVK
jgi:arylsulfatase